jgi:hypothetical protein
MGQCEFSAHFMSEWANTTWHHVFGRMHIIEEPWASFAPLTLMLCDGHHIEVHSNNQIRIEAEWLAVNRFCAEIGYQVEDLKLADYSPVEIIKTVIRQLNESGSLPHGYVG